MPTYLAKEDFSQDPADIERKFVGPCENSVRLLWWWASVRHLDLRIYQLAAGWFFNTRNKA